MRCLQTHLRDFATDNSQTHILAGVIPPVFIIYPSSPFLRYAYRKTAAMIRRLAPIMINGSAVKVLSRGLAKRLLICCPKVNRETLLTEVLNEASIGRNENTMPRGTDVADALIWFLEKVPRAAPRIMEHMLPSIIARTKQR